MSLHLQNWQPRPQTLQSGCVFSYHLYFIDSNLSNALKKNPFKTQCQFRLNEQSATEKIHPVQDWSLFPFKGKSQGNFKGKSGEPNHILSLIWYEINLKAKGRSQQAEGAWSHGFPALQLEPLFCVCYNDHFSNYRTISFPFHISFCMLTVSN